MQRDGGSLSRRCEFTGLDSYVIVIGYLWAVFCFLFLVCCSRMSGILIRMCISNGIDLLTRGYIPRYIGALIPYRQYIHLLYAVCYLTRHRKKQSSILPD